MTVVVIIGIIINSDGTKMILKVVPNAALCSGLALLITLCARNQLILCRRLPRIILPWVRWHLLCSPLTKPTSEQTAFSLLLNCDFGLCHTRETLSHYPELANFRGKGTVFHRTGVTLDTSHKFKVPTSLPHFWLAGYKLRGPPKTPSVLRIH